MHNPWPPRSNTLRIAYSAEHLKPKQIKKPAPPTRYMKDMTAIHVSEFYGSTHYTRSEYLITDGSKIVGYMTRTSIHDCSRLY